MTEAELGAFAAGGIFAGMTTTVFIFTTVLCVLLIIAEWKIFTKAGEKGWKSLIPIYNLYVLYKICGLSFVNWFVLPVICGGVALGIISSIANVVAISSIGSAIIDIIVLVKLYSALADSFGKDTGFKIGLIFLPNIFTLILGFGSAEYVGPANKE